MSGGVSRYCRPGDRSDRRGGGTGRGTGQVLAGARARWVAVGGPSPRGGGGRTMRRRAPVLRIDYAVLSGPFASSVYVASPVRVAPSRTLLMR